MQKKGLSNYVINMNWFETNIFKYDTINTEQSSDFIFGTKPQYHDFADWNGGRIQLMPKITIGDQEVLVFF